MLLPDHLFALLIAVIYPAIGFVGFRRLVKSLAAGARINRSLLYRNTMTGHWILFALCLALWLSADRSWASLGFGLQVDLYFLIALLLTVAGTVLLVRQVRQVETATAAESAAIHAKLGSVSIMIPRTRRELMHFNALSVTAGIVEEVLWRGYLIWYLTYFTPLWVAALMSAVGFGLAHAYQGARQVPQIVMVGAVFTGLFVLSGSLWLPILFHGAVDILQGKLANVVVNRADAGEVSGPVAGASA